MRRVGIVLLLFALACGAAWMLLRQGSDGGGADDRPAGPEHAAGRSAHLRGTGPGPVSEDGEMEPLPSDPTSIPNWSPGAVSANEHGTGRVFVRLVDGQGAPLPNHPLEVSWWKAFGEHGETLGLTDEDGRFRTEANEPWEIETVATPENDDEDFPMLLHQGPFLTRVDRPEEVIVEMPVTGWIRGRVVDLEGTALFDQVLVSRRTRLDPFPFRHRLGFEERTAEPDDDGRFEVLVVAGTYEVGLDASGPLTHYAQVVIDETHRIAEVELRVVEPRGGRTLDVTVQGLSEAAERGVSLSAFSEDGAFEAPPASADVVYRPAPQRLEGKRIGPGLRRVEGITGDAWELYVWEETCGGLTVPVPPGATEMTVTLEPKPQRVEKVIRLVGLLPDGTAVSPIHQVRRHGDLAGSGFTSTANDGDVGAPIHLFDVEPVYLVLYGGRTAYAGVGPLRALNAPDRIEVPLEPGRASTVTFTDAAGRGLFCEIQLRPAWAFFREVDPLGETRPSTREGFAPCSLDTHRILTEDGRATFGQLGSTPFEVLVRPGNPAIPPARGVIRGGETVALTPGEGVEGHVALRGRVVNAATGGDVAGATVRADSIPEEGLLGSREAVTDDAGRFVLAGLPARPTRLRCWLRGYALPAPRTLDLAAGSPPIEIRLAPARWVSIRVVDADDRPLATKRVEVRRSDGTSITFQDRTGSWGGEFAVTDVHGRVDLGGVPAALVDVWVTIAEGEEPTAFPIDVREPPDRLLTLRVTR